MPTTLTRPAADWQTYKRVSRTGTYGFLAALPLILMYEVLVVFVNRDAMSEVRVGAEVWLKQLLALVGDTGLAAFGGVVLAVAVGIFWYERKRHIPLRLRYFVWMVLESAVYAVLVAFIVSGLVGAVLGAAAAPVSALHAITAPVIQGLGMPVVALQSSGLPGGVGLQLALSIGAGVYEELLFRVLLVGGLYLALRKVVGRKGLAYVTAAVIGAFLFSLVHYVGPLGDAFTAGSFLFRFFFGLVLNVLFLMRGFGIAAWTHALYDVMVVLLVSG